jgi:hypothetical protein
MKTRSWLGLSALVLLLTVLLTFLLQDIARDWVAVPLARTLQLGNLVLGAVPQIVFWVLLLVIGSSIAMQSLMERKKRPANVERVQVAHPGRVRTLLRWVQHEPESVYFRQRLAYSLAKLATELQAYRQKRALAQFGLSAGRYDSFVIERPQPYIAVRALAATAEDDLLPRF